MSAALFKVLGRDREPIHGGTGRWPEPGVWLRVPGPVRPCYHGLHVCRPGDLPGWVRVGATVWRVEIDDRGAITEPGKVVVEAARLIDPVGVITSRVLVDWVCACADRVAHLAGDAERVCLTATRVRRLHVRGLASAREMTVAWAAAGDAAGAAAGAAGAAGAATMAAGAAVAADGAAAGAAGAAAWAAAGDAAGDAARAAARAAEREWQADTLLRMVGGAASTAAEAIATLTTGGDA